MFYDKKIKYLNYIVNGERIKGCGFVKVELRDRILNLEVVVTGLSPNLHSLTEVWLCAERDTYPLGQICLEGGRGNFRLRDCDIKEVSPTGVSYAAWKGISIFLSEGEEISGLWGQSCNCVLERVEVSEELVGQAVAVPERKMREEGAEVSGVNTGAGSVKGTDIMSEGTVESTVGEQIQKPKVKSKETAVIGDFVKKAVVETNSPKKMRETVPERMQGTVNAEAFGEQQETKEAPQPVRLAEDKWEQIAEIYPHIRPFRDKREYLSIRPADFVLLSSASYKMVNNSFLLHGYHNYQHLILARAVKKGEVSYYVGTPGNFFEREKQVAIMFGFTSFECAKDPAREGDFGYYLMEVQL